MSNTSIYWIIVILIALIAFICLLLLGRKKDNDMVGIAILIVICIFLFAYIISIGTPIVQSMETYTYISHEYTDEKIAVTYEDDGVIRVDDVSVDYFYISSSKSEVNQVVITKRSDTTVKIEVYLTENDYKNITNGK